MKLRNYLENKTLEDTIKAYERIDSCLLLECGESAVKIREGIAQMRTKLYDIFTDAYINFIHEKSNLRKIDITKFDELVTNLKDKESLPLESRFWSCV